MHWSVSPSPRGKFWIPAKVTTPMEFNLDEGYAQEWNLVPSSAAFLVDLLASKLFVHWAVKNTCYRGCVNERRHCVLNTVLSELVVKRNCMILMQQTVPLKRCYLSSLNKGGVPAAISGVLWLWKVYLQRAHFLSYSFLQEQRSQWQCLHDVCLISLWQITYTNFATKHNHLRWYVCMCLPAQCRLGGHASIASCETVNECAGVWSTCIHIRQGKDNSECALDQTV